MGINVLDKKKLYFISFFLYNFARVLPHAILTVILLEKGMTVGNIAIIQSFFMLAGIIFEFPSGILTDIWSEKNMYLISLILITISYLIIVLSSNFLMLCFSWFIYGISSASMSGSLETYFLRNYDGNLTKIKIFNVQFNNINLISTLIGGGIGSFVYALIGDGIYYLSIVLLIISYLIILLGFHSKEYDKSKENKISEAIKGLKIIKSNNILRYNIFLMATFQIILQIFFQFWQVIFINQNFDKKNFGLYYVIFQIMAILGNLLFKKGNFNNKYLLLIITITSTFIVLNYNINHLLFFFILMLFLISFNIYNNQLIIEIQKDAPTNYISSVTSFMGTLCSFVSIILLWFIGFMDKFIKLNSIIIIFSIVFLIISILFLILKKEKNKATI